MSTRSHSKNENKAITSPLKSRNKKSSAGISRFISQTVTPPIDISDTVNAEIKRMIKHGDEFNSACQIFTFLKSENKSTLEVMMVLDAYLAGVMKNYIAAENTRKILLELLLSRDNAQIDPTT